jgi:predicted house-cleaning noncanonical NTP pyrophosphatase (MazG superfamily)
VEKPVQLMALTRVDGVHGAAGLRAFHFTTDEVQRPTDTIQAASAPRTSFVVRDFDDVAVLRANPAVGAEGVRLRPDERCRRDLEFLREVSRAALDADAPIYFEGSLLGHAFHVMRETGAIVIPIDIASLQGPRVTHNKLVRDRIPTIVERSGSIARVRALDTSAAEQVLRQKLVEEALEALSAGSDDLVEEMADLREVLAALEALLPDGPAQVQAAMERKRADRGGFDELLFLEFTTPATLAHESIGSLPQHFDPMATQQNSSPVARVAVSEEGWTAAFEVPLVSRGAGTAWTAATELNDAEVLEMHVEYGVVVANVMLSLRPPEVAGQAVLF